MEVHRKLAPDSRYFIGPDLDRHLDAILQNSMAVADVSRDRYRETILQLCSEVYIYRPPPSQAKYLKGCDMQVLALRKKLGENLAVVTEFPNSLEARYIRERKRTCVRSLRVCVSTRAELSLMQLRSFSVRSCVR